MKGESIHCGVELCFETPNAIKTQGVKSILSFTPPGGLQGDIIEGTEILITCGDITIKYTMAVNPDPVLNELPLPFSISDLQNKIADNFDLSACLEETNPLVAANCGELLQVRFTKLSGGNGQTFQSTGLKAELYDQYSICLRIRCVGDCQWKTIRIPALPESDCENCLITSVLACKEIQNLFGFDIPEMVSCDTKVAVQNNLIKELEYKYSEQIAGAPVLGTQAGSIFINNLLTQKGDSIDRFCRISAETETCIYSIDLIYNRYAIRNQKEIVVQYTCRLNNTCSTIGFETIGEFVTEVRICMDVPSVEGSTLDSITLFNAADPLTPITIPVGVTHTGNASTFYLNSILAIQSYLNRNYPNQFQLFGINGNSQFTICLQACHNPLQDWIGIDINNSIYTIDGVDGGVPYVQEINMQHSEIKATPCGPIIHLGPVLIEYSNVNYNVIEIENVDFVNTFPQVECEQMSSLMVADLITHYKDGDTVCLCQCILFYLNLDEYEYNPLEACFVLYDEVGNILAEAQFPIWTGTGENNVLAISGSIMQWDDEIKTNSGGFIDFESVAEYSFQVKSEDFETLPITLKVECCDCFEQFMFLSEYNVWETITSCCIDVETWDNTREALLGCQTCEDAADVLTTNDFICTYNVKLEDKLNNGLMKDFLNSRRIKWFNREIEEWCHVKVAGGSYSKNANELKQVNNFTFSVPRKSIVC